MRILVDMDGIVADFFKTLWADYLAETGETVVTDQIHDWDMTKFVQHGPKLVEMFHREGFFAKLDPLPGAVEALKALNTSYNDLVILSYPCTAHAAAEKIRWCAQHLPFINKNNIILTNRKELVDGDVLIDDNADHIKNWKNGAGGLGMGYGLGIQYPYNTRKKKHYDLLADGHKDPAGAWSEISDMLINL